MPYPHVFSPITINGLEIKNRIIRSAHGTGLNAGGLQVLVDYHEARAKGGVGLTILEVATVHPTTASSLLAFRPEIVSDYEQLAEASHRHGMKLFQQLWHAGNNAMTLTGGPPWAPSRVMGALSTVLPVPMTKGMIDEVVEAYARAARHCQQGGLDGVEIHGAHGYLLTQFMSPVTNLREDDYGGSFENRMRFPREVIAAVRSELGDDYPLGIRLTASEGVTDGIGPQENLEIALALEADGLLDFFDVSVGSYYSFDQFIGGMHEPHGYELERSTVATRALSKPTIVTGRVITVQEAEDIIASGQADMVSMVRATLADPDIVRKAEEGREADARPCIGCNQGCIGGSTGPLRRFGCTVNVGAGQEGKFGDDHIEPAEEPKRVFVIGGGPSGMEAARVAALRGHQVTLFEATDRLGGQIQVARQLPHREEIGAIVDWLEGQLRNLEVDIRLNTNVDAGQWDRWHRSFDWLEHERPDAVIVATGSTPRVDGFQQLRPTEPPAGLHLPHVWSYYDVAEGNAELGTAAVVLDDVGHYPAIGVAEKLLDAGLSVTFVTRHYSLGSAVAGALMQEPALRRLTGHPSGFRIIPRAHLAEVTETDVLVRNLDAAGVDERVAADMVVLMSGNVPNTEFAELLDDYEGDVTVVGDALAPRWLEMAIHSGHYAALEV
ncbi:MAG: FAD-dependent oxidoreductase [Chloroflexota bacterium]|nr:FAD-dependent oxidoreductase [Chloroflexota bacterium]